LIGEATKRWIDDGITAQIQVPPYFSRNTVHYGPETYIELRTVVTQTESDTRGDEEL
jgi:hypothetical protein